MSRPKICFEKNPKSAQKFGENGRVAAKEKQARAQTQHHPE